MTYWDPAWGELADDLGARLPATSARAEVVARVLRDREPEAGAAAAPLRVLASLVGSELSAMIVRARHAVSELVPLRSDSRWPTLEALTLRPLAVRYVPANEVPPRWMRRLAEIVGIGLDEGVLDLGELVTLRERQTREWTAARNRVMDAPDADSDRHARDMLRRLEQQHDTELAALDSSMRILAGDRAARINQAQLTLAELLGRAARDATLRPIPRAAAWSLYDAALGGAPAFWSADDALELVVGRIDLSSAAVEQARNAAHEALLDDERPTRISVRTKPPIRRRMRAGHEFGLTPKMIDVREHELRLILADAGEHGGLIVDTDPERHARELAERDRRIAELESQLAAMQTAEEPRSRRTR